MRRTLIFCAGLMVIAGCGNPSERAYYQTRYVPTSSEVAYSSSERAKWKGDLSVYELPAAPPDLDNEALPRNECAKPGPQFKAQQVVGLHDDHDGTDIADIQDPGGWDKRPVPVGALRPLPGYEPGIQRGPDVGGIPQPNWYTKTGDWDKRPVITGITEKPAQPAGVMRAQEKTDYCLPVETPQPAVPAGSAKR